MLQGGGSQFIPPDIVGIFLSALTLFSVQQRFLFGGKCSHRYFLL